MRRANGPSRRHANAIDRPYEIRIDLSADERKTLGQLAQKHDLTYSGVVRKALEEMAKR